MEAQASTGLSGVPETMLWTLHNRAGEAQRADGVLDDPKAIEIYRAIDYDYVRNFGRAEPSHALRAKVFDEEVRRFLDRHPDGVVVNLGEGLETQRYRIDAPRAAWLTVDLPEAIAVRERFIPADDDHRHVSRSALDRAWFETVPSRRPLIVTAQGLFMYFTEEEVRSLLRDILATFDRCCLVFDTVPKWLSRQTVSTIGMRRTLHYKIPAMPWGIDRGEIRRVLRRWLGSGVVIDDVGYPYFPRGLTRYLSMLWFSAPGFRTCSPTIVRIRKPKDTR